MKGDTRCVQGRLYRHEPDHDDPDFEMWLGICPECNGAGCEPEAPMPPFGPKRPEGWRDRNVYDRLFRFEIEGGATPEEADESAYHGMEQEHSARSMGRG